MYTLIDWLFTLGSWFLIFFLPFYFDEGVYCLVGMGLFFLYPIALEIMYNCLATICYTDSVALRQHQAIHKFQGLPIVYNSNYNITACGIEKLHPFDSCKYQRVYEKLIQEFVINEKLVFQPQKCSRGLMIRLGISKYYLFSLCYSWNVFRIVEVPICVLPGCFLRSRLLDPMLYSTQGTIDAVCLALERGWGINIGGGYHHASMNSGGGFCVYPDITLGIKYLRRFHPDRKKVIIIDLDAHQGNGHERDFSEDPDTFIIDLYNHSIYPGDHQAKKGISEDVSVGFHDSDENYCEKVRQCLKDCLKRFNADFVLYNAGTDCMENDPLGNMNLSAEGIIERDFIVFSTCIENHVPVAMVLSGGYQRVNAPTIADSIRNIIQKLHLK